MAELHSNQIAFSAPETAKANLAVGQDYISPALQAAAETIETAAIQRAREDDVALASKVKSAMVAGEQDLRMGDSINGDYSALKNKALDRYQVAFEGAPASAIARYRQQNPNELDDYETGLTAIEAQRSIASADIRIKKEMPQWASAVALGQMSWEDAVAALHVMGGEFMTADKYEGYTFDLRSDIDRFQVAAYQSGTLQDNLKLVEDLKDPNKFETLTATERANAKATAQAKIDSILKAQLKDSGTDKDETYKAIRGDIINSAEYWSQIGDTDQLDLLKRDVLSGARMGRVKIGDKSYDYSELTPEQWGTIITDLEKIRTRSPEQKKAEVDYRTQVERLTVPLEQQTPQTHMSDVVKLDNALNEHRATDIFGPADVAKKQTLVNESYDNLARSLRSYGDIDTQAESSFWQVGRASPWAAANTLQDFVLKPKQSIVDKYAQDVETFNIAVPQAKNMETRNLADLIKMMRKDKNGEFSKAQPGLYNIVSTLYNDALLSDYRIAELIQGKFLEKETKGLAQQTMQNLTAESREVFFNGQHAREINNNTRAEYMLNIAALLSSRPDIAQFGHAIGLPEGVELSTEAISKAAHIALAELEVSGKWNDLATEGTRKDDADTFYAALGLHGREGLSEEQKQAWRDLTFTAGYGQSNRKSNIGRWLDTPSPVKYGERDKMYIDGTWTPKKKE